jgi:hypothetical protein
MRPILFRRRFVGRPADEIARAARVVRPRAVAFGMATHASRILVNSPATREVIGQTTGLEPSLVLGCGYYGGTSTGDNVGFRHLRNLRRLAFCHSPEDSA